MELLFTSSLLYIRLTMKTLVDREYAVACEVDMTIHNACHIEFRVCLMSKPLKLLQIQRKV